MKYTSTETLARIVLGAVSDATKLIGDILIISPTPFADALKRDYRDSCSE